MMHGRRAWAVSQAATDTGNASVSGAETRELGTGQGWVRRAASTGRGLLRAARVAALMIGLGEGVAVDDRPGRLGRNGLWGVDTQRQAPSQSPAADSQLAPTPK